MSSKMFLQGTDPSFWRTLLSISLLLAACPPPTTPSRGDAPKAPRKWGGDDFLGPSAVQEELAWISCWGLFSCSLLSFALANSKTLFFPSNAELRAVPLALSLMGFTSGAPGSSVVLAQLHGTGTGRRELLRRGGSPSVQQKSPQPFSVFANDPGRAAEPIWGLEALRAACRKGTRGTDHGTRVQRACSSGCWGWELGQEDLGTRLPPGLGTPGSCSKLLGQQSQFLTLSLSML